MKQVLCTKQKLKAFSLYIFNINKMPKTQLLFDFEYLIVLISLQIYLINIKLRKQTILQV